MLNNVRNISRITSLVVLYLEFRYNRVSCTEKVNGRNLDNVKYLTNAMTDAWVEIPVEILHISQNSF